MAKKKFPYVLIKDAKNGFRVHLVGGNGEKLMNSEVLESVLAIRKNLAAVWVAMLHKDSQSYVDKQMLKGKWLRALNIRYEGKSEAIYKAFEIEKPKTQTKKVL